MKLYNFKNEKVSEVNQIPFKLEKEIQSLVEKNTESIFDLLFVQSELTVNKYRIDTLCFDEESLIGFCQSIVLSGFILK